jgi:hypothetical protein
LICSFRKLILSSMMCCRVIITIWRTKAKTAGWLLNKLAP